MDPPSLSGGQDHNDQLHWRCSWAAFAGQLCGKAQMAATTGWIAEEIAPVPRYRCWIAKALKARTTSNQAAEIQAR